MRPVGTCDVIEGRICFNGAVDVVKKALVGVGAAKTRLGWKAARRQLLLTIDGAAIVGGMLVLRVLRLVLSEAVWDVSMACDT